MDHKALAEDFRVLTDSPSHIKDWIDGGNNETRDEASLDRKNEFDLPSGRHNAEKVLKLKQKAADEWDAADFEFAGHVVNYAKRSGGIAQHHPHAEKSEVGDTGMTKNEIARRNWGLPAKPKN